VPSKPLDAGEGGSVPFRSTYGASQRHVADLADLDGAGGFILPTGQSGLPFDAHYDDQWELWRHGGLWRIPLDRPAAEARVVHRLVLRPASE
jgi:penicillin amidase